mmetsp:Transcript_28278/g.27111  ORF Transcript_28278/g.27111 Transcript_28278/m.27111 type:complete len:115 (-) Transcript_28278:428-772(-)
MSYIKLTMDPIILEARQNRIDFLVNKNALKSFTLDEVKKHTTREDGWIIVDGYVYNITAHVINHAGWGCGCQVSQLLAIMRTLGTDCTDEMIETHSERALLSVQHFLVGVELKT